MPKTTFEAVEIPAGPMPPESEALLTRYYLAKLESLQFCGPTNFNCWFWDGFETLAFIFPATMWLSRVFADMPRAAAIARALEIVDDNFGFNSLLGSHRHTRAMRTLASRGEMARLIAWYSR